VSEFVVGKPLRLSLAVTSRVQCIVFPPDFAARLRERSRGSKNQNPICPCGSLRSQCQKCNERRNVKKGGKIIWGNGAKTEAASDTSSTEDEKADGYIKQRFEVEGPATVDGQQFAIVGSHPTLGGWVKGNALRMLPAFNIQENKRVWSVTARVPEGERLEYKYVLVSDNDSAAIWESKFHNRQLTAGSPKVQVDRVESFVW